MLLPDKAFPASRLAQSHTQHTREAHNKILHARTRNAQRIYPPGVAVLRCVCVLVDTEKPVKFANVGCLEKVPRSMASGLVVERKTRAG